MEFEKLQYTIQAVLYVVQQYLDFKLSELSFHARFHEKVDLKIKVTINNNQQDEFKPDKLYCLT